MALTTVEKSVGRRAIEQARAEVEKEAMDKSVKALTVKLRELKQAEVVVANIEREIADLEAAIDQGNG